MIQRREVPFAAMDFQTLLGPKLHAPGTALGFQKVDFCSIKVQTWNTFGLSQPSLSAEWEKIKRSGQSKLRSHSLSRMMVL